MLASIVRSQHPLASLLIIFTAWKVLLLTLAILSPGPGYDTSTQLLFRGFGLNSTLPSTTTTSGRLAEKLTRWDAIYFVSSAERGYQYEQEWAFGWGLTRAIAYLAKHVPLTKSTLLNTTYHGIILANVSHLLSVFVLYRLALDLPLCKKASTSSSAFVAATLHILSPAGLFLSATYGESTFSLLNFLGQSLYVSSYNTSSKSHGVKNDILLVLAGICFCLSSMVRGNGLLNRVGIPILNTKVVPAIFRDAMHDFPSRRVPATVIAGLLVGIGFATPQYVAWGDYCSAGVADKRPWCNKIPPSIFSWVQKEYWLVNVRVGFMRYWTISNIPLFLLATPMLYIMARTAILAIAGRCAGNLVKVTGSPEEQRSPKTAPTDEVANKRRDALLFRLALPQLTLAVLALTTFHVQIITRLSSGYSLWYLVLAQEITDEGTNARYAMWTLRWIVMYALIQGVLFANFLPPA
ncbi:glycosyltransferase family 76 protein [Venturia nashicola]|uniref:GPI mannosyltransferase 2 n=1 Tax=Venturia nashicola TaxID=86259 RepID=A0A4Z1NK10_9PEZI|nr:glycosyltransferase family 76 protein [Venturia nashicola]